MNFIRPSVLLFALIITLPAIYRNVVGELDVTNLLIRFLIAVPIAAVLLAVLRFVTAGYGKPPEPAVTVTPEPVDAPQVNQPS